jgi:protease PrsW
MSAVIMFLFRRGWFQIGLGGVLLFILLDVALKFTLNPNYLPTFIMLGAFTVPVAFAAYFYRQENLLDRNLHHGISLITAAIMFLLGGAVGTVAAGVLESLLAFHTDWATFLSMAAIEEASKLIFPVAVFFIGRYRSEADGLVFGLAAGLGFASLETMGYSLSALLSPFTQFSDLEQMLIMRGVLSPLGHAAWTGLVCGAIWHYQGQGRKLPLMAVVFFLLAVALHFTWNMVAGLDSIYIVYPAFIIIGSLGLFLVFRHLHHARQKSLDREQIHSYLDQ